MTGGMRLVPSELRLVRLALSYALFAGAMHRRGVPWDGRDRHGCPVPFPHDARQRAHARELLGRIELFLGGHDSHARGAGRD